MAKRSDIRKVNEAIEDGDGCAGAWEAMAELRRNEAAGGGDERTQTRRRVLKKAAAGAGISVAGLQALVTRAQAKKDETSVREVKGKGRRAAGGRAT